MAEPLTVLDEAPQAIGSVPHGSQVRELLAVYQEVLDTADDLPMVPMVLRKRGGRLHYLPRPKWLVRYFLVGHVRRSLTGLSRRYSARAALGQRADGEQRDREAVREFQESLPPDRQKLYLVLLIAAILVVVRPVIYATVPVVIWLIKTYTRTQATASGRLARFLGHGGASSLDSGHLRHELLDKVQAAAKAVTNVTSINEALTIVLNADPLQLSVLALGVALSTYVVLLPFVPAFRLKRMLFNLAPEPKGRHRSAVARWSVSQATGLYESEHRAFAELGTRPPKEFPFDLPVSALAMVLPVVCCSVLFVVGALGLAEHRKTALRVGVLAIAGMACVLIPILARSGWLFRTWQRRQLCRSGPYMPFEVGIRSEKAVAKVENPIGWRLLFSLMVFPLGGGVGMSTAISDRSGLASALMTALVTGYMCSLLGSLLVSLRWWYRINRELRDLDRSYGSRETGIPPGYSLCIMILSWFVCTFLPCILVFSLVIHIRRAQARAAQSITAWSPWVLAPGVLLYPALFAYLQHELNKIWAVEGQPLDPRPADTSLEGNWSTGTLPWLKANGLND